MIHPRKHALADMTFAEFRERLAQRPVILLPLGSQEEQGPHAPMGDFMLTERLALRAAEVAGAIAAPTLPFGYAPFFRDVPGGVQLRADTFRAVLADMIGAFLDHGIERLLIFNGHTSNGPLIDETARTIRRERGVAVPSLNVWQVVPPALWQKLHGEQADKARGHGGDPITSVYLHLFPELMRPDLAKPGGRSPAFGLPATGVAGVSFEGLPVQLPLDATEVNPDGMLGGDPSLSTAAIGAAIADHIVGFTARLVAHLSACDPRNVTAEPAGGSA